MRHKRIVSNVRIVPAVLGTALVALTVMQSLGVEPGEDKKELGFVSLFDGKTFDGWLNPTHRWSIKDGRMVFSGEPTSGGIKREDHKLMSVKEYEDFILRFEFKIGKRANSGVAVRAPLKGDAAFVGMEIQIIDQLNWKGLKTWQAHGSIYGVVAAKTGHLKQPGEWNTQEILCQGSHVKVTLNGAVIVDVDLSQLQDKTLDGERHPGVHRTRGHIGFLPHTRSSEYRNIRIKVLQEADQRQPYQPSGDHTIGMNLDELTKQVASKADELRPSAARLKWQQIPWMTNLAEGLKVAQQERRPVFLWGSDDEPLERC